MELRLPISNVGVRISAVFPRKQRVSALVVHCLRRSSSHLFAGLGLSRGLSPLLKTLSNTLLSLGGTSDVAILHTLFGWNTLRLEHSSAGTLFGLDTLRLEHSAAHLVLFPFPELGWGEGFLAACESHSTSASKLVKVAGTPGRGISVSSLSLFPRGCAQQKTISFRPDTR